MRIVRSNNNWNRVNTKEELLELLKTYRGILSNPMQDYLNSLIELEFSVIRDYIKDEDQSILGSVDEKGQDEKILLEKEHGSDSSMKNLYVANDYIFYIYGDALYRCDLDGQNETVVLDVEPDSFCIEKGTLYFAVEDKIKKCNLNGEEIEELADEDANFLNFYNGSLYFTRSEGPLCRMNPKKKQVEEIGGSSVGTYVIFDNKFYYTEAMSADELASLSERLGDGDKMDSVIYLLAMIGSGSVWSMNLDGTDFQEVEDAAAPFLYRLYSTPNGLYYQAAALLDIVEPFPIH